MTTRIEWADDVWNPTVGCSRVSPGCDNCYAMRVAHRGLATSHQGLTIRTAKGVDWTGAVRALPERLTIPLRRRKPTRWFVDSMSDLFHPAVVDEFIARVWAVMALGWRHQFLVLTKRPKRMAHLLASVTSCPEPDPFVEAMADEHWEHTLDGFAAPWPLPNVWLGTSIESDRYTFRADHLRATPAAVRWLSLEPLLGPLPSLDLTGIDWVVVGGESGPGARPMHPDWVRDIRDRCLEHGVPFFFKQWGAWLPTHDRDPRYRGRVQGGYWAYDAHWASFTLPGIPHAAVWVLKVGKTAAGRHLDGRTWDQLPGDAA